MTIREAGELGGTNRLNTSHNYLAQPSISYADMAFNFKS